MSKHKHIWKEVHGGWKCKQKDCPSFREDMPWVGRAVLKMSDTQYNKTKSSYYDPFL